MSGISSHMTCCVDEKTEFFNGMRWKPIKDYIPGEKILQWHTDGTADMASPLVYMKKKNDEPFYHYVANSLDICTAGSGKIAYFKNGFARSEDASAVFDAWQRNKTGFKGKIPLTFRLNGTVNDITPERLRVAAMVNADASYCPSYLTLDGSKAGARVAAEDHPMDIYEIKVYKQRKKERAVKLLKDAGIDFYQCETNSGHGGIGLKLKFHFDTYNFKHFPQKWIFLDEHLKTVLLDEILHWDGSVRTKEHTVTGQFLTSYRWCSSKKDDADIIQMIATSCGRYAHFVEDVRNDDRSKQTNYTISFRDKQFSTLTKKGDSTTGELFMEYPEMKYGFMAQSGYVVLRRNNHIYITGDGINLEPERDNCSTLVVNS